jgi:hypothetical protein
MKLIVARNFKDEKTMSQQPKSNRTKKTMPTSQNNQDLTAQAGGVSPEEEGAAAPPEKHDSLGKFFYLWFGIPFAAMVAAGFAAGHC